MNGGSTGAVVSIGPRLNRRPAISHSARLRHCHTEASALFGLSGGSWKHRLTDLVVALGVQNFASVSDVAEFLVLAELDLADKAGHFDLQPNDCLDHRINEFPGRITHLPWDRPLVSIGQLGDIATDVTLVIVDRDPSVRMRHQVVPSRNLLVELLLARIPLWRDVCVRRTEHHEMAATLTTEPLKPF